MIRLRRTASTTSSIGVSIAALLLLSPPLAAEETGVLAADSSALQVRFYDNSPYAQVSRIRSLSFLTLTDSGKSRWFLGINSDGVVGLHYRAKTRQKRSSGTDSLRPHFLDRYLNLDTY